MASTDFAIGYINILRGEIHWQTHIHSVKERKSPIPLHMGSVLCLVLRLWFYLLFFRRFTEIPGILLVLHYLVQRWS